jgi:hypothetical protein
VSAQLLSIQKILQQIGTDAYLRSRSPERNLATLGIEIETGPQESNMLEVCEIPIPDSDLFLLQWFVQLPLSEPFSPADSIPEFQIPEVMALCAELNQILPIGIFNVFEKQLCFRHIFTCEFVTTSQVEYLVQTIESTIQRVQPLLQEVAIGAKSAEEAIASIDVILSGDTSETEPLEETADTPSTQIDEPPVLEPTPSVSQRFSIDDIANMKISIEEEQSIDDWTSDGTFIESSIWDLLDDYIVFDEDSDE